MGVRVRDRSDIVADFEFTHFVPGQRGRPLEHWILSFGKVALLGRSAVGGVYAQMTSIARGTCRERHLFLVVNASRKEIDFTHIAADYPQPCNFCRVWMGLKEKGSRTQGQ
jgi:hypothetical protein